MNRYMIICRLRWPLLLILTGVIFLLDQQDILSWSRAWPLYLILFGVLALAERAALASQPLPPQQPVNPYGQYAAGYQTPGYANPGYAGYPPQAPPAPPTPPATTSIVPTHTDLEVQSTEREPRKSWEEEER